MNGLVVICILLFFNCGVSGYNDFFGSVSNASTSASESVHTIKDGFDINRELGDIRKNRRGRKRPRRYTREFKDDDGATPTINKVFTGIGSFLKTYLYQPIGHGNFMETTIRSYNAFNTDEGKFLFGTLDGELNKSFRSLMRDRHPRTGDIISCRIPTDRMAEHYMMVINNKIAEVGVVGGKSTHNGVIIIDSYRKSSYINSTECLYHENRILSRAEQIDEKNGDNKESDLRYEQILDRVSCTVSGKNTGHFNYDMMSCNCQDVVLYWAYGYVETNCLAQNFANGCSRYLTSNLINISDYVDESGSLKEKREQRMYELLDNPGIA